MFKVYHIKFVEDIVSDETVRIHCRLHSENLILTTVREILNNKYAGRLEYEHVANVYVEDSLNKVYELTNNIDESWVDNTGVENVAGKEGYRSTSTGDIFEDEFGTKYIVDIFGFTKL